MPAASPRVMAPSVKRSLCRGISNDPNQPLAFSKHTLGIPHEPFEPWMATLPH